MAELSFDELKALLDAKVKQFNHRSFIANDPISIPHRFKRRQDIEVAGFFAALFAWGNRVTVINKSLELLSLMGNTPHSFVCDHTPREAKRLASFVHRTFNGEDIQYFVRFLKHHYQRHESLEDAFPVGAEDENVEHALNAFHDYFFSLPEVPEHVRLHMAAPKKQSSCKRLNMFLRWMVRSDMARVDFGLWKKIKPAQLICPIDVHVERTARKLKLLTYQQLHWDCALELTNNLRKFDPRDPVKYDYALFGLGMEGRSGTAD